MQVQSLHVEGASQGKTIFIFTVLSVVFLPLLFFTQVVLMFPFIDLGAETITDYCSIFQVVMTKKEMELLAARRAFSGQSRVRLRE
jgi:hypothetical protein